MSHFNNFVTLLNILTSPLRTLTLLQPPATSQLLLTAHSDCCTYCTALYWWPTRSYSYIQKAICVWRTDRQLRVFGCIVQAAVGISTLCLFPYFSYFPYSTHFTHLIPLPVLHISLSHSVPRLFTFFHCFSGFFRTEVSSVSTVTALLSE